MATLRCLNPPSSARLFVQLASPSRSPVTASAAIPTTLSILDVLAPRWSNQSSSYHTIAPHGATHRPPPTNHPRLPYSAPASPRVQSKKAFVPAQTRTFASTVPLSHTSCVFNPQKDEDGNDMFLDITDRAGKRLTQIMQKDSNPNLALRIQVESGGCHGFQYLMSLVTLPAPEGEGADWSSAVGEDDSVFQYAPDADAAATTPAAGAPKVVLDMPSLELLKGSKVDFTMELIGSQFKITDNPHASSACGCGTSFDIKI